MSFPYVNSVSAQQWYGINVNDYSISAQRWYRIELKVLIVVCSDKDLHIVLLEGTKENELSTCDSKRPSHEKCILFKEWLEKKSTYGCWSKKRR